MSTSHATRLVDFTPRGFQHLDLEAFEAHDLAQAKLGRNSPRDREDVAFLASRGVLDRQVLQGRFDTGPRPFVQNEARESSTPSLWLDELFGAAEP